ncbi:hypothetical protein quinque_003096 [Culex quinquefasciatus]
MGTQLQLLGAVVNNYYNALNANRPLVNATFNDFGNYINKTYTTMNKTYGITQKQNMETLLMAVPYFNEAVWNGEKMTSGVIREDLNQMSYSLQKTIDTIFEFFQISTQTIIAYDQSFARDKCAAKNMTQMIAVPSSLSKLGPCLQQEINTVSAITPTIVATIKLLKNDLAAFNGLLNICQPTSTTCLDAFFSNAVTDLFSVITSLNMVFEYIGYVLYDANTRNQGCAALVNAEVMDNIQNLLATVTSCIMS